MNTYIISLHHFKYCTASFFIRVDATNEAVYELVAEPIRSQSRKQGNRKLKQPPSQILKTSLTPLTCKASPGA